MEKIILPLFLLQFLWPHSVMAIDLKEYEEINLLTQQLVEEGFYTDAQINYLFKQVEIRPSVVKAFKRPAEKLTWGKYKPLFITDKVIRNGVDFWHRHQELLSRASQAYGVPEEIIVAIIGVETRFGTNKGKHKVLNSLVTLSLQYERRKTFFQSELVSFLKLAKSEQLETLSTLGSYAGAMGIPQFIASSYQAYSVDFDNDGKRDLINSYADAIGSVANYFNLHGWQQAQPIYEVVSNVSEKQLEQFAQSGPEPQHNATEIQQSGVILKGEIKDLQQADIIKLVGKKESEYYVVFDNFYVIKRYNRSNLYAMAVAQLSQSIKRKYRQ